MAKKIYCIRHGIKDAKGGITTECLQDIMNHGILGVPNSIDIIDLGSSLLRTAETGLALANWLRGQGVKVRLRAADARFGSDEMFKPMLTDNFRNLVKSGVSNHVAALADNPELIKGIGKNAVIAIREIFDGMSDDDELFLPGHSPIWEEVYAQMSDEMPPNFAELQGFSVTDVGVTTIIQ